MSTVRDTRDPSDPQQSPVARLTLVTGFLGAGKTTAIRHWLGARPVGERWAVLVNDFGVLGVDAAAFAPAEGVEVFEVAGGCACCAAAPVMRTALARMLRRGPWDRILVELSGLGHPGPLIDQLRSASVAMPLRIDGVVALVDASRPTPFLDAGGQHRDLVRAQLDIADLVIVTRTDRVPAPVTERLLAALASGPFGARPVLVAVPQVPAWPQVVATLAGIMAGGGFAGRSQAAAASAGSSGLAVSAAPALPVAIAAGGRRRLIRSLDDAILAWQWPPEVRFDRRALVRWADALARGGSLVRGKGAFRTERDWYLWQHSASGTHWESTAWRRDNRVECLFTGPLDSGTLDALGHALLAAREPDGKTESTRDGQGVGETPGT